MSEHLDGSEIAIIGMAGRFPGADNIEAFWENLCNGASAMQTVDDESLKQQGVPDEVHQDPKYVKAAYVMDGIDQFDPAFFGYSPREAELIDPQQRVLLECAWHALEHAGYDPETYKDAIGVFAGGTTNSYLMFNIMTNPAVLRNLDYVQLDVSNGADFLATRISYKLDLDGPAYTVATGCSTSLVAVHVACQNLWSESCDMALAGGVSINVKHPEGYRFADGSILSPDGFVRAFDARAGGTVFGSGVGMVLLKRLERAEADCNHIHAIIRGSAINNDGSAKVGFTAPSVEGQSKVIIEALADSDTPADSIGYVEAHGTGTQMGDPIEVRALSKAWRGETDKKNFCGLGSVKTNVGHLSSAGGVAALIKTVMMLEHGKIPPSLHFDTPNPEIDFANSPFYVPTELKDWPEGEEPRRAAVSSFGVGGTNAHVILEQAPPAEEPEADRDVQILVVSARTAEAREQATANLAGWLDQHPDANLADVAYTLQQGRRSFDYRTAVVVSEIAEAATLLRQGGPQLLGNNGKPEAGDLVFCYPGQGSQYAGMARQLYKTEPEFRNHFDRVKDCLRPHVGLDLAALIFAEDSAEQLTLTQNTQPALFAVSYALARTLERWGYQATAHLGHSVGEYVAATMCGVFALDDACALIATRGRLIGEQTPGAMLAVSLDEAALTPMLDPDVVIAAINAPDLCVVSGPTEAIEAFSARLKEKEIQHQALHTSHAFHSNMMEPAARAFREHVSRVTLNKPNDRFISNVSGTWITDGQATDPNYWAQHLRGAVRFADGVNTLVSELNRPAFLEVGPGNTLSRLVRRCHPGQPAVNTMRHATEQGEDLRVLLSGMAKLWLQGIVISPFHFVSDRRNRLAMPLYPFQHKRYWINPGTMPHLAADSAGESTDSQEAVAVSKLDVHERPNLSSAYTAPQTDTEKIVSDIWARVLGIEPIGIYDDFFELGGHSLLVTQIVNELQRSFNVELPVRTLFDQATVHEIAKAVDEALANDTDEGPVDERLRLAFPTERKGIMVDYFRRRARTFLGEQNLKPDGSLTVADPTSFAVDLMLSLKQDLGLTIYAHELTEFRNLNSLAEFTLGELERKENPAKLVTGKQLSDYTVTPFRKVAPNFVAPEQKNPSMVFLHSSPRAGSTLLRIMLAGHGDLFCPPELNLFFFADMKEWTENVGFANEMTWTTQGVQWALVELLGLKPEEALARVEADIAANRAVPDMYRELQELCGKRLLVDKTPPYALDMGTLERAEVVFEDPKYIFLVRHPHAVIESFIRIRLDKMFAPALFGSQDVDPYVVAEAVWAICNRNLLDFTEKVSKDRVFFLRYEDMVVDPAEKMGGLCDFLGVPFSEALINPYDGRKERMIGGLGDPNIMRHKGIDPKLADVDSIELPYTLSADSRELAAKLGYEIAAPTSDVDALAGLDDDALMAQLAEMGDDAVLEALKDMLPDS